MFKQKDRKYVQDCKVIPGESAVKQQRLMVITMALKVKERRTKMKERIRTWKLKYDNLITFKQEVQLQMSRVLEKTWENLKSSVIESAKKICGFVRG